MIIPYYKEKKINISFLRMNVWLFIKNLSSLSLHRDTLHQVWLKFVHWFCRWQFLNFIYVFLLFHFNHLMEKGVALRFIKLNILFTQECFVPSLKLAQCFWRRREKCEKFTTMMMITTTTTGNRQIVNRKAHLSLLLRLVKITRGPQAEMVTWVSKTLYWLLVRRLKFVYQQPHHRLNKNLYYLICPTMPWIREKHQF